MIARARYRRFAKPDLPREIASRLPQDYAAIRFYFRPSFPDTPRNHAFVKDLVGRVAKTMPVVLLNTGIEVDDHADCPANGALSLEGLVTPTNNLDVQTRVIANARAFIGTYGGLSYLAPFFGVPSIAFHSDDKDLKPAHLEAIRAVCRAIDGRFIELHVDDVDLLRLAGIAPVSD
jgi:ADP-heptose:LPS heptosyltransferase